MLCCLFPGPLDETQEKGDLWVCCPLFHLHYFTHALPLRNNDLCVVLWRIPNHSLMSCIRLFVILFVSFLGPVDCSFLCLSTVHSTNLFWWATHDFNYFLLYFFPSKATNFSRKGTMFHSSLWPMLARFWHVVGFNKCLINQLFDDLMEEITL